MVSSRQWPSVSRYRACVRTQSRKVEMIDSLFKRASDTEDEGIIRWGLWPIWMKNQTFSVDSRILKILFINTSLKVLPSPQNFCLLIACCASLLNSCENPRSIHCDLMISHYILQKSQRPCHLLSFLYTDHSNLIEWESRT